MEQLIILGAFSIPSNKEIHLSQLERLMQHIPIHDITVDQLFLMYPHALFRRVYAACLMHAFYRPADPTRTYLLLLGKGKVTWQPNQPAPTHILGLLHSASTKVSILLWGTCRLVEDTSLEVHYTFYDSAAAILSLEDMQEFRSGMETLIMDLMPSQYTVARMEFIPSYWSDSDLSVPGLQHHMIFCQLISTVVYEFPCNFSAPRETHPVRPLWAPDMVEAKVRILLGQLVEGTLSLEKVTRSDSFVPPCVYLHG